jgi:hypothetical protein
MRMAVLSLWPGVLGGLALLLSGCGGGPGTLYPVSCKVTVDGAPLQEAHLFFVADAEKGDTPAEVPFALVKDGSYSITTAWKPGAPAGRYKARVRTRYPGGPDNPADIPRRYFDPNTSGLTVEVVASPAPGAYDLSLKSQ